MTKVLLLLAVFGSIVQANKCQRSKTPDTASDAPLVQLDMHGCRGFCPTYKLVFRENGRVEYDGIRNMVKPGKDTFFLNASELKQLRRELEVVNLWQYPEYIKSQIADAPSARLTVFRTNEQHEVMGSMDRPEPILKLEALLKDLAEAHGLKVKTGVDPTAAPPNQQTILVKFKPDVNPGNFLMQFEEIRLRIVRRVSAENEWLIGYNPDQISEKQISDILKEMPEVLAVSKDKK